MIRSFRSRGSLLNARGSNRRVPREGVNRAFSAVIAVASEERRVGSISTAILAGIPRTVNVMAAVQQAFSQNAVGTRGRGPYLTSVRARTIALFRVRTFAV